MPDPELTFNEVLFPSSPETNSPEASYPKTSQQDLQTTPSVLIRSICISDSPKLPKMPNPTTTVSPVMTPAVLKPAWNYTNVLEEAFPDAEFRDDEEMSLSEWLRFRHFESPSEDYRLAVLIHDRLGWKRRVEDREERLMSGALPNEGEEEAGAEEVEVEQGAAPNEDARNEDNESDKDDDPWYESRLQLLGLGL